MFKYPPIIYLETVYHTVDTLAEAFGLSKKLLQALVKRVDPNAPVRDEEILVSELTFRKLKLPFCRNWLHVVYAYVRQAYLLRQSLKKAHFEDDDYYDERIDLYG